MAERDIGDNQARRVRADLDLLLRKAPTRRLTRRDLIRENRPLILELRERGHSWDAIARTIGKHGPPISAHTVRQYVQSARSTQEPAAAEDDGGPSTDMDGGRLHAEIPAGSVRLVSGAGEGTHTREDAPARSGPASSQNRGDVSNDGSGGTDEAAMVTQARGLIRAGSSRRQVTRTLMDAGFAVIPTAFLAEAAERELGGKRAAHWLDELG